MTSGEKKKKVMLVDDPKVLKKRSKSNPKKDKARISTSNLKSALNQTAKTPVNSKTEKKKLI